MFGSQSSTLHRSCSLIEFYALTIVGGKWLCVVIKYLEDDAFVVTADLTAEPKAGDISWPIN
jgi:hypothetical protein